MQTMTLVTTTAKRFVLGRNQSIPVDVSISVALVARPDSILRAMLAMDITMAASMRVSEKQDGLVLDPLDGLEVILENSTIVGQQLMFDDERVDELGSKHSEPTTNVPRDEIKQGNTKKEELIPMSVSHASKNTILQPKENMDQEDEKDDLVERETKRMAEKMRLLHQRAQEAMARRKTNKQT
jgi:hypothetical protein